MTRRRIALTLVTACLVVLAGCSAGDTGSPSADPTSTENASALQTEAVAAIEDVETYRMNGSQSITVRANLAQQIDVQQNVSVNRPANRSQASLTQSSIQGTTSSDRYLVNGTVYVRSQAYAQQFATEWVKITPDGNLSNQLSSMDGLSEQRRVLESADFELNGTESVGGAEAYRLETTDDLSGLEDALTEQFSQLGLGINGSSYTVENGSYTFWLSTDTHRPLRVVGNLTSTIELQGQSLELGQSFTYQFDYETPVSIELPEEATNAPRLSDLLNESNAGG